MSLAVINILQPLSVSTFLALTSTALLLLCSGLVSGSEVAFFSLNPADKEELKNSKSRKSKLVSHLLGDPPKLLATILIANNFINVAIIVLSTFITINLFDLSSHPYLGFLIQVVVITFLILLFGEVIPKVYSTRNSLKVSRFMAYPIHFLQQFFTPLSVLLISSTSIILKRVKQKGTNISVDDLSDVLELASEDQLEEEDILKGIVKFGNTDVKQIMKPRLDVVAFDIETTYDELIVEITDSGYSRIPIYKESFDQITGILYIKDLLPSLKLGKNGQDIPDTQSPLNNWQSLIRPPFFVPENKKIDDLLKEFQEKKIHLAIVVDEYGGTSGIATLEDIIEEIVGDISDEHDEAEIGYTKLDQNTYVFEGKTALNDVYRIMDIDGEKFEDVKGDSDTLAGFVIELVGKIPVKNEKIAFLNFSFTIESADTRRVKQIKVSILQGDKV
ncbi:MAG TPA: gliding motility-associated protein GldE [Flavobacteriales bacterium]|nr:gliding motility-associated protein GldE [Flavobacteriales bacterium]HIA12146.1 gliding motility-associated protein GldE [Flavobacteriales bacterium]